MLGDFYTFSYAHTGRAIVTGVVALPMQERNFRQSHTPSLLLSSSKRYYSETKRPEMEKLLQSLTPGPLKRTSFPPLFEIYRQFCMRSVGGWGGEGWKKNPLFCRLLLCCSVMIEQKGAKENIFGRSVR